MDLDLIIRFILALLFVLALIGLFAWAARRFGLTGRLGPAIGKARRLRIVEVAPLDPKTRLVLLRRDDVEHLVLVGPGGGLVVESGIRSPDSAGSPAGRPAFAEIMAGTDAARDEAKP
jgi:flagellar protein FliO/FliZ